MAVKKMYSRINAQIFVWAGDEPLVLAYNGETIVVPPYNETAVVRPGTRYRFESARDSKGQLIPGTVLVKDQVTTGADGISRRSLVVADMCDYLTRDRDDLFGRGFNIVGTPGEINDALEQGRPLFEASQDARARQLLATELERRKRFEAKGEPAPPREDEHNVIWAIAHLRKRGSQQPRTSVDEIRGALEGTYVAPASPAAAIAKSMSSAQEIYERAIELGIPLTKTELAGLLGKDPEQTAFVLEKIKLKQEAAAAPA